MTGDVVKRRELGDEPDEERCLQHGWRRGRAMRARRGVPSVTEDVIERRELGDEPDKE
jgi:hypothetical protein